NGRALSFEDVPAELLAGVDVYKNPSAALIEGGIGGTINLRTRQPFDFEGLKISGSVGANHYDFIDKTKPTVSGLISNRWQVGEGELGVLLNLSYQEGGFRTDTITVEPFWERNDIPGFEGQTVNVPSGGGISSRFGERERRGIAAALQYSHNDNLEFYANYLQSNYEFNEYDFSYFAFIPLEDGGDITPNTDFDFAFGSGGDMLHGSFLDVNVASNTGHYRRESTTADYSTGVKWQVSEQFRLTAEIQYVDAETQSSNFMVSTSSSAPVFNLDLSGSLPGMSVLPGGYLTNPDNYYWNWVIDHIEENTGQQRAGRVDGVWEFNNSAFLDSFSAGIRYTERDAKNKATGWRWAAMSSPWDGFIIPLNDPAFANDWTVNPFNDFFMGKGNLLGATLAGKVSLISNHNDDAVNKLAIHPSFPLDGAIQFSPFDINTQTQETLAAYSMLSFEHEITGVPMSGNVGVRVVQTSIGAQGWTSVGGALAPTKYDNDYTDVLPSLNLKFSILDNLILRMAASKGISRPNFNDLNPNFSINVEVDNDTGELISFNGGGGNPELKPMEVEQFDAAVEWYFGEGGLLYATLFRKNVDNFITNGVIRDDLQYISPITGEIESATFTLEVPLNGEDGKIKGYEVGTTLFFDFLPAPYNGFGIQANYTYVDSAAPSPDTSDTSGNSLTVPLEGLSEHSYNLIGMYEWGALDIRVAYNWRDEWVRTTRGNGTGELPVFDEGFGQLDASIGYQINDTFRVQFDAVNISNTQRKTMFGVSTRPRDVVVTDTRYGISIRGEF
ncbi:MAG: TonB-dependent receptor, partial [Spongiibacteraceae bacterium]|nr:TonB-dependent receptor [Spongiibacteraceae bacterium]